MYCKGVKLKGLDMEQKRILWITAAVGVFLLVVLGGALIIYSPQKSTPKSIAKSASINDSNGWVSIAPVEEKKDEIINLQEDLNESVNVQDSVISEEKVPSFNPNFDEKSGTKISDLTVNAENVTIVNKNPVLPVQEPVKEIDMSYQVTKVEEPSVKPVSSKNKIVQNQIEKPSVVSNVPSKKSEVKKNTSVAKKSVTEPKKQTKYWVQVASLTSRKNADSARDVLGENKITADVFTYKDTSNKLYYRVRVGPYTTKSEAEYWRGEIAKIDSFTKSQSYVTSTVVE